MKVHEIFANSNIGLIISLVVTDCSCYRIITKFAAHKHLITTHTSGTIAWCQESYGRLLYHRDISSELPRIELAMQSQLDGCIVWNAHNTVLGEEALLIHIVPRAMLRKTGLWLLVYTGQNAVEIWRFFKMAAAAILDFFYFKLLTVRRLRRVEMCRNVKFGQNRSNREKDMTIFQIYYFRPWLFQQRNLYIKCKEDLASKHVTLISARVGSGTSETNEPSVGGGDEACCQITVATYYGCPME